MDRDPDDRVGSGGGGRPSLYLTVAGLDAIAIALAWLTNRPKGLLPDGLMPGPGNRRELFILASGVLLMLALGCLLMPGKIAVESLEGDATEIHGFAASLFGGGFPDWDLEVGVWGFYPTFMFVSYPVFFSLALGGISEAALRLPALLFLGILILATAELARTGHVKIRALHVLPPILATGYLSLQVGAYYSGYYPFHGDLASSPIVEWLVTALAMSAVVLIRHGVPGLGAVAAFLSIVAFPSGLMLVGLVGVAGFLAGSAAERRALWKWGLVVLLLLAGYAAFVFLYTAARGTFEATINEWLSKYFTGRGAFAPESPEMMLGALAWYVLLAGGLPVVGYGVALFSRDPLARWLALVGALWVAFFVLSPSENIHYFMPAALIPVAVAIRAGPGSGLGAQAARGGRESQENNLRWRALAWAGLLTLSSVVVIILSLPTAVPPFTADREFGRQTVFLASTEREAVEYSMIIYPVIDRVLKPRSTCKPEQFWAIGHHTWVRYSDRTHRPLRKYDFYVGRHEAPVEGLEELARIRLGDGGYAVLSSPDGWAAFRRWEENCFGRRKELSRFNFDIERSPWN